MRGQAHSITTDSPRSVEKSPRRRAILQQSARGNEVRDEPLAASIQIRVTHSTARARRVDDPTIACVNRYVRDRLPRLGKEHDVARPKGAKVSCDRGT
jgi:hypothetical protein